MAAGKWKLYDLTKVYIGDGTLDLNSNTMKIALFSSASNCNTLSLSPANFAALTGELTTANGYTAGGASVTGQTYTNASGTVTFDCGDVSWTAAGGSITARFAVLYAVGTLNGVVNPLIAVCLLDTTPADVTATDGNPLNIVMNASGLFTLSGANVD